MRQRKHTAWLFVATIAVCGALLPTPAVAQISGPTTCTVSDSSGNTATIALAEGFPKVIQDNVLDTSNYCGNETMDHYPCTVFAYTVNTTNFNYDHVFYTIPFCPESQLSIPNASDFYPLCNPPGSPPWLFSDSKICSMKSMRINNLGSGSGLRTFWVPVYTPSGTTVGLGINNILLSKNGATGDYFPCKSSNPEAFSGIVGPSCYTSATCQPSPYQAKMTNVCLPNVNGQVLKVDVANKAIENVYKCPTTDTGCASHTCDPAAATCDPTSQCVKQETYEVDISYFDEAGNSLYPGVFTVRDAGGTVEEAIGYFVLSDSPGVTCITGLGGRTICITY